MKKSEIEIGKAYMASLDGSILVPVGVLATDGSRGWQVTNLVTGQRCQIKSSAKLHRKCTMADLAGCKEKGE